MCGIAGFVTEISGSKDARRAILQRMAASLAHRGPDGEGIWQNGDGTANLCHRRLSIIDLSSTGSQPMGTSDGRYTITFNGEIYNFSELRNELLKSGCEFRGASDTEVLVQAIAAWGVEATLPRLNGMFAFAVWDAEKKLLYLARDRFGEKPLYYGWFQGVFIFGSELKALSSHPAFCRDIDENAVASFMRFNYVPWPQCIFKSTWKLGPGQYLRVQPGREPDRPSTYWSMQQMVGNRELSVRDPRDPLLIDEIDHALRRAVRMRMVSDVPLGAFLSGGIDSSTVVAMMQAQSSRPVKTFTIGFWEAPYNEANDAGKVARHLGTEHHEIYLTTRECTDTIVRLPDIYDEPFADSSQIPTTLVSEFTRKHVSVALSGDAGDEMFGGYNRYFWTTRIWPLLSRIPLGVRHRLAVAMRSASPAALDRFFAAANRIVPSRLRVRGGGEKLHKLARTLDAQVPDDLYRGYVSQWQDPAEVLLRGCEPPFLAEHLASIPANLHYVERMMFLDTITYLPSDILCKVDRASMSCGLEARVPFLDNDVAALAWSLPLHTKIHKGVGKWPLRRVLERYVPAQLFERPKTGFGVPIGDWLRGPLRPWAEEMLSEASLQDGGWFKPEVVRAQWHEHKTGRFNRQHSLWSVLMFQAWLRNNGKLY